MKRIFIFTLLTCFTMVLSAQQKNSFIGLHAGSSIPVGKFHMTELPDGGFAQTGLTVSLEGAWFFKSWLGVGASAGMYLHPVDVGSLGYEKKMSDPFITDLSIRSEPYHTYSLYAGLFFRFPAAKKLCFTAKALGGVIYSQTPYQLYKAEYEMIGKNWYEITSSGDFEGSFLVGAGVSYDLNTYLGFAILSEFSYNEMDFNFTLPGGTTRTDKKVVAFVNLAAGIYIKI